jgi:predicted phosphodiesterase
MARKEKRMLDAGDEQAVIALHRSGMDVEQICRTLNVVAGCVRYAILQHNQRVGGDISDILQKIDIGHTPVNLAGDNWMITCDWHVPQTDWALVERMVAVAKKHNVRRMVIAGDFFDQGQFSRYASVIPPTPWSVERDAAHLIMDWLLGNFDEIVITMGNHDRRLIKWADAALDIKDVWGDIVTDRRVHVTQYGWCTITTSRTRDDGRPIVWRATHPKNYSQIRGKVGGDIADMYDMSVISGHEHHTALTKSRSGRHWAMSLGGLYDSAKISYAVLDDGLSTRMAPSFGMLLDGYPYLFADGLTDWAKWGC